MWELQPNRGDVLRGRVRAVSLPDDTRNRFAVWTDHGTYTILLIGNSARVRRVGSPNPRWFNPESGALTIENRKYTLYGQWEVGGEARVRLPEPTTHPAGERVEPDPETDDLVIFDPSGVVRQRIPNFHARTEPWSIAAFSPGGSLLLVADPHGVRVFEFTPERGKEKSRWQAGGNRADRDALFAAVLANPDDDTPRLVYADWLQEHGDAERAEFIRLQCQPHRDTREFSLMSQLGARWKAELPIIRGVQWDGFVRGFAQVLVESGGTLARAAEAVWAASPVERLTLAGFTLSAVRLLAQCPHLARVRWLVLKNFNPLTEESSLATLLGSPQIAGLRHLRMAGWGAPGDRFIELLTRSSHLENLEELSFGYWHITPAMALALARSPRLSKLRRLNIYNTYGYDAATLTELRQRFEPNRW